MRLFPNLIQATAETLFEIFNEGKKADHAVEKKLKSNPKWGARDRRFIAENTYEVVRWKRLFEYALQKEARTIEDWWAIVGVKLLYQNDVTLPPWKEFKNIKSEEVVERIRNNRDFPIKTSIPDWLSEIGYKNLGDEWEDCMLSLNEQQEVVLRVNTLKSSLEKTKKQLELAEIKVKSIGENAFVLSERKNIRQSSPYKNGSIEIQDFGSQQIAPYLQAKAGELIVDACAGAGGKSLHLAQLMNNRGKIISMDIHDFKLKELRKRASRAGVNIIKTKSITAENLSRLQSSADAILLDVPCSGLGVLRRNPDAKWKLSPSFIEEIKNTQQSILQEYSKMTKIGGRLVYATCSILKEENEHQVQKFLASPAGEHFAFVSEKTSYPHRDGYDGFYMALLIREK